MFPFLTVDAGYKDGKPDMSTDFNIPHAFECAFADPAQMQKVCVFQVNAYIRSHSLTGCPLHP